MAVRWRCTFEMKGVEELQFSRGHVRGEIRKAEKLLSARRDDAAALQQNKRLGIVLTTSLLFVVLLFAVLDAYFLALVYSVIAVGIVTTQWARSTIANSSCRRLESGLVRLYTDLGAINHALEEQWALQPQEQDEIDREAATVAGRA